MWKDPKARACLAEVISLSPPQLVHIHFLETIAKQHMPEDQVEETALWMFRVLFSILKAESDGLVQSWGQGLCD